MKTDDKPFHSFALPTSARGMSVHDESNRVVTAHFDSKVRITTLIAKS